MVVQLAEIMFVCMIKKPARLTANALFTTTAMNAMAELHDKTAATGGVTSRKCKLCDDGYKPLMLQVSLALDGFRHCLVAGHDQRRTAKH